jgi:integrase
MLSTTATAGRQPLSHVEKWKVELQKRGLSESTIRSAHTILRAVLHTAVRDEALAKDPAAAVARPKVARKEAPHLTAGQIRSLPPRLRPAARAHSSSCW